ncbi:MAG: hypothetical protein KVP17_001195 [Porospora cf. gigantea B]|uniref:uncharacterized protein n=2 Tax=Porospora cf. gigantea B TaxID=2853592 RepID=UPI00357196D2|nr:MAG: hypothetical protein KVP17_001195 [Porospora cf. gigantea B]
MLNGTKRKYRSNLNRDSYHMRFVVSLLLIISLAEDCFLDDTSFEGPAIARLELGSREACITACRENGESCQYATFEPHTGNCTLMTSRAVESGRKGRVSARMCCFEESCSDSHPSKDSKKSEEIDSKQSDSRKSLSHPSEDSKKSKETPESHPSKDSKKSKETPESHPSMDSKKSVSHPSKDSKKSVSHPSKDSKKSEETAESHPSKDSKKTVSHPSKESKKSVSHPSKDSKKSEETPESHPSKDSKKSDSRKSESHPSKDSKKSEESTGLAMDEVRDCPGCHHCACAETPCSCPELELHVRETPQNLRLVVHNER